MSCIVLDSEDEQDGQSDSSDPSSHEYIDRRANKRRRLESSSLSGPRDCSIWSFLHASMRPYQSSDGCKELAMTLQDSRFRVDVPDSVNYGEALRHASSVVSRHLESKVQRYKIGYTHRPFTRFYREYEGSSYAKDYNFMVIISALPDTQAAGMMEASLIREFQVLRKLPGCANVKLGGDNIIGNPPGFVYIVLMELNG